MADIAAPPAGAIHVEIRDHVAYLTLDRPPLNVLTIEMLRQMLKALEQLGPHLDLRVIVLRGQGRGFSAGLDLGQYQGENMRPLLAAFRTVALQLLGNPVPIVAAVQGLALAAGLELAATADILLVAEDAVLGLPQINVGTFPSVASVLLPRIIGTHRALELILTGESIRGVEAERIGLANRAVPPELLDQALAEVVSKLSRSSAVALRLARRAVIGSLDRHVTDAIRELETLQADELQHAHDAQEGVQAFLEKRAPVWLDR